MNYKTLIGIFVMAAFLVSRSDPEPQGAITGDIEKGKTIFDVNCTICHQKDGTGLAGFAPSIHNIDFLETADDQLIKRFILEGRAGTSMIPFKNNPNVADNIDDLVAYMRSWTNDYSLYEPIPLNRSWKSNGDGASGEAIFNIYCSSCHGSNGEGYSAGGSGTGIANKAFLAMAPDDYIKQTLILRRAGTAMKSFDGAKGLAHLTDGQMNDVVAFLRTKGAYEEHVYTSSSSSSSSASDGTSKSIISDPYVIVIICITMFALFAIIYMLSIIIRLYRVLIKNKAK